MGTKEESSTVSREKAGDAPTLGMPLLADLMSTPNCPVSKAFLWCGWRTLTVDWLFGKEHDLSKVDCQEAIGQQLQEAWIVQPKARPERSNVPFPIHCVVSSTQKGSQGCHCRTSSACLRTILRVRLCWIKCSLWLNAAEGLSGKIQPTVALVPASGEAAEGV